MACSHWKGISESEKKLISSHAVLYTQKKPTICIVYIEWNTHTRENRTKKKICLNTTGINFIYLPHIEQQIISSITNNGQKSSPWNWIVLLWSYLKSNFILYFFLLHYTACLIYLHTKCISYSQVDVLININCLR